MNYKIAVVEGDGVGPEIVAAAKDVLAAVGKRFKHTFTFADAPMGGCAIDKFGEPLPQSSVDTAKASDSVLLGAVGGPKWDYAPKRPEEALLGIRKALGLFANLRPVKLYKELADASPLAERVRENGIDFVIVRELTGGIYFGEKGYRNGAYGREAYDVEAYGEIEIERIARTAFELAEKRNKRLLSVDKANVLLSSKLWRKVVHDVAEDYPTVVLDDMYVDNAAMQLIRRPSDFDVVLTSNMFGDILSDLASALVGSIGLMPSASFGVANPALFEPIHGSAPDIAGTGTVNPVATIMSAAMMLRLSFNLNAEAAAVENAVAKAISDGCRTKDVAGKTHTPLSTEQMTREIIARI
ncbi:MAG: 3-isopropylmalate dehydrogenase [Clostridiaceae bacterium]|jgi:3-isopropylmalate dehydrogenase|nr:3-isopropylmalate dehydrogenase [Clostridiaceae bacterium]